MQFTRNTIFSAKTANLFWFTIIIQVPLSNGGWSIHPNFSDVISAFNAITGLAIWLMVTGSFTPGSLFLLIVGVVELLTVNEAISGLMKRNYFRLMMKV